MSITLKPLILSICKRDVDAAQNDGGTFKFTGAVSFEPFQWEWQPGDMSDQFKVTLQPGATLTLYWGGPTEEGYSNSGLEVTTDYHGTRDGELWKVDGGTSSRDCDGPHETAYTYWSDGEPCDPASSEYHSAFPWRSRTFDDSSSQRDHYAEAMGY